MINDKKINRKMLEECLYIIDQRVKHAEIKEREYKEEKKRNKYSYFRPYDNEKNIRKRKEKLLSQKELIMEVLGIIEFNAEEYNTENSISCQFCNSVVNLLESEEYILEE